MAKSGTLSSSKYHFQGSYGSYDVWVEIAWSATQSSNKSTISWSAKTRCTNSSAWSETWNASYFTINGTKHSIANGTRCTEGTSLGSGSFTVTHDSSGNGSFSWNVNFNFVTGGSYNSTGSGKVTLDKINVTPTYSPSTVSLSASSVNLGSTVKINITLDKNSPSSFKHTLTIKVGSTAVESFSNLSAGSPAKSFTPAISKYATYNSKGSSISATVYCTTYNGSTKVGEKSVALTLKIPDNSTTKPTVAINNLTYKKQYSYTDSGTTHKYNLKGITSVSFNIDATAKYGASIKSRAFTFNGTQTSASSSVSNYILPSSGSNLILAATAKDSRGFTGTSASTKITVVDYKRPTFDSVLSQRYSFSKPLTDCIFVDDPATYPNKDTSKIYVKNDNSLTAVEYKNNAWTSVSPTKNPEGEFLYIKAPTTITSSSVVGKNNRTYIKVRWRKKNTSSWSTKVSLTTTQATNGYVIDVTFGGTRYDLGLDPDYTYDVEYSMQDLVGQSLSFSEIIRNDFVSTGFSLMSFARLGKSMAICKVSEPSSVSETSCLEVGASAYFYKTIYIASSSQAWVSLNNLMSQQTHIFSQSEIQDSNVTLNSSSTYSRIIRRFGHCTLNLYFTTKNIGGTSTLFTLPAGWHASYPIQECFKSYSGDTFGYLTVNSSGVVRFHSYGSGTSAGYMISISYPVHALGTKENSYYPFQWPS